MKTILIIALLLSGLNADFTKNENGVIHDDTTNLEWSDNSLLPVRRWEGAIKYCKNFVLDEKEDWRLPNTNEIETIIDRGRQPMIKSIFTEIIHHNYWLSTTTLLDKKNAYIVFLNSGEIMPEPQHIKKATSNHFVCVRGG